MEVFVYLLLVAALLSLAVFGFHVLTGLEIQYRQAVRRINRELIKFAEPPACPDCGLQLRFDATCSVCDSVDTIVSR